MHTVLLTLALTTLGLWLMAGLVLVRAKRTLRFLEHIPLSEGSSLPSVTVIIPARNEERNLEQALQSVLQQNYPQLDVLVVNDRSTDRTGAILERMAQADSRLQVHHVSTLPSGWLGKNHALHAAAQGVSGEFILFTDADVVMHPLTVRTAIQSMQDQRLDHLTIAPEDSMPGWFLRVVAATFGFFFLLIYQPWKARDPRSRKYIGIGAFNLVRASAYRAIGGHHAIAMRPDDDVKLGKLIKQHGFRQYLFMGRGMVSVEWYASVRELIQGLMKNSFAAVEYHFTLVVLAAIASLLFHVWPFVAVMLTSGFVQLVNGLVVLVILFLFWHLMGPHGIKPWQGFLFPVTVVLLIYIQWKSALIALWSGDVTWRGTRYPLSKLRANKV